MLNGLHAWENESDGGKRSWKWGSISSPGNAAIARAADTEADASRPAWINELKKIMLVWKRDLEKLRDKITALEPRVANLERRANTLENDVRNLKAEQTRMSNDISQLKNTQANNYAHWNERVGNLDNTQANNYAHWNERVGNLDRSLSGVRSEVTTHFRRKWVCDMGKLISEQGGTGITFRWPFLEEPNVILFPLPWQKDWNPRCKNSDPNPIQITRSRIHVPYGTTNEWYYACGYKEVVYHLPN